ncbi:hypothetical protein [Mycobacterium sp. NPDC050853]|uniref:hypothetical protein n=1 Tax=Mycobacterium sp. NPDC050853 TaxID=3155160 RepID=UPI0033DFBFB1
MSERHEVPRAPNGLKTKGAALWRSLHEQFDFSQDPHRSTLVEDICRTADAIDRMQKVVDKADDLRVKGSQSQPVAMPELPELRQYRALKARLLKDLALPDTDELAGAKAEHLTIVRRTAARAKFETGQ